MVTENRQNLDHFQDSTTLPKDSFFENFFELTCSAGSTLDAYVFSWGTLYLWISEFGLKSDYIDQISRSLAISKITFSFIKVFNMAYARLRHIKIGHKSQLQCTIVFL